MPENDANLSHSTTIMNDTGYGSQQPSQTSKASVQNQSQGGGTPNKLSLVKYGELIILGYNGCLPQGDRGRRRSKFVLYRRQQSNGIVRSRHYEVQKPQTASAVQDTRQHSISYSLSRNQAVIVEYKPDETTDLFQVIRNSLVTNC